AFGPLAGLLIAAVSLRCLGGTANPSTSDDYLINFHDPDRFLDTRPFLRKIAASIATLGLGGPMGLEGPSIYIGASIGSGIQQRLKRLFANSDSKILLVAGAAAGVAAIFKAPATGAIFAIEVPFQNDLGRRLLLPSLVGAASGYLAFVAVNGTTPLFPV